MALSFPLTLGQFFNGLEITEQSLYLSEGVTHDETAGGEIYSAGHGPRMWEGVLAIRLETPDDADQAVAKAELLQSAGASFQVRSVRRRYPQSDPDGTTIGAAMPTLGSVAGNNRDATINNLPVGFVITAGDFIGWTYDSGPQRFALHKVVTGATADGSGNATVEVYPPARSPIPSGGVRFNNNYVKARMVPGSFRTQTHLPGYTTGFSFRWRQTLK